MDSLRSGDPARVGPYRLINRLGMGGIGTVYLAHSPGGRRVAVKVVHPHLAAMPDFRVMFAREVAAAMKVNGLYTAVVVDADTAGQMLWLATGYVPGPTLATAVRRHGPMHAAALLSLFGALVEGLQAIHAAGIVHRNLTPHNVLLAPDGPRIIDFGISSGKNLAKLDFDQLHMGSPQYSSPEGVLGEVGTPDDIFSLGSVIAYAATGTSLFRGNDTRVLFENLLSQTPPDLSPVPGEIRRLVAWCLEINARQRPTIAELKVEIGEQDPEPLLQFPITDSEGPTLLDADDPDLLLHVYVPADSLFAEEQGRWLELFGEWLTRVRGQAVRREDYSTRSGRGFDFFSNSMATRTALQEAGVMREEGNAFSAFLGLCVSSPTSAIKFLRESGIGHAASSELVARFSRESRKLDRELRQEWERQRMSLRHSVENELSDIGFHLSSQLLSEVDHAFDNIFPRLSSAWLPTLSDVPTQTSLERSSSINIGQVINTYIQTVNGSIKLGAEANELLTLIDRYGGNNSPVLKSAVHELEDHDAPLKKRQAASQRVRKFIIQLGDKIPDLMAGVLEKYIESKIGL